MQFHSALPPGALYLPGSMGWHDTGARLPSEITFMRSDGTVVPLVPEPFCENCCKPIRDDYADLGTCFDCNKNRFRVGAEPVEVKGKITMWTFKDMADLRPFYFRRAGAAGLYVKRKSVFYREIWQLKRGGPDTSERAAELIAESMHHALEKRFNDFRKCTFLVPIPSGSGLVTAPTLRLANALASFLDRFSVLDALEFVEGYVSQRAMKTREDRWENPKDKFLVDRAAVREIRDQRLLLIDDTFTEGATTHWAAKALLDHGCAQVDVLVAGRACDQKELDWIGYEGRT